MQYVRNRTLKSGFDGLSRVHTFNVLTVYFVVVPYKLHPPETRCPHSPKCLPPRSQQH